MIVKIEKKSDLNKINQNIESIYLQRAPTKYLALQILKKLKKLKTIYLSPSSYTRTGKKIKSLLKENSVNLKIAYFKGKPIINPTNNLSKINDYKRDALSIRKISEKTGIPKSTIHYLFKYAKKNKLKKDNIIIILKKAEVLENGKIKI